MLINTPLIYPLDIKESQPSQNRDRDVSWAELQEELAKMQESLLKTMANMINFIAQEQVQNSKIAQINVGLMEDDFQKAKKAEEDLQAALNPPWWKALGEIFLKYILPLILCAITAVFCGPAAAAVAVAIFLLTAIPISNGESVVSLCSEGIADVIGDVFHLSPEAVQLVKGIVSIVIAVVLAVVGGFAATGSAVSGVEEAAEGGAEAFANSAGKFAAANAFSSTIGNTNCFHDIFMSSYLLANPNADKEKAEEYAAIFAMIMNLVVSIGCMVVGGSALSDAAQSGEEYNPLAKALGGLKYSSILRAINNLQIGANIAGAGVHISDAIIDVKRAQLMALITRLLGSLQFEQGLNTIIETSNEKLSSTMEEVSRDYQTMLGKHPNFSAAAFTEAREMAKNNRA